MADEQEEWSDGLDALLAAPQNHTLLFENEQVRVLDARVGAGETVPLHTHRWPSVIYIISWSDFVRRDAIGTVVVDSRGSTMNREGQAVWSAALGPHTLENVGGSELRAIVVEQKGC